VRTLRLDEPRLAAPSANLSTLSLFNTDLNVVARCAFGAAVVVGLDLLEGFLFAVRAGDCDEATDGSTEVNE